jgi:hypothetical protein
MGKFIWQDGIVALTLFFNVGAIISTAFLLHLAVSSNGAGGYALEQNPIMRVLFQYPVLLIIAVIIFYAWFVRTYMKGRANYLKDISDLNSFKFNIVVLTLFFLLALDGISDLSILFKILV